MNDYNNTPIINALKKYIKKGTVRFHMPGHKGKSITHHSLGDLLDSKVFLADITNVPGMDDLHQAHGVIKASQQLAAQIYGADYTYYLVNGSSCGLQALLLAVCNPGDKILVPRNIHRSILSGIILSGAIPVFYWPAYEHNYKIPLGVTPQTIQENLINHPDVRAVLLVNPTYHGITSDISNIAQIVHRRNIPLLVDEAHGPHLIFHQDLPASSLECGADASVHGSHKMLPAFTQASMLHLKGSRLNRTRLEAALRLLQSTSTSYLLLASLEAACMQMSEHGEEMLQDALDKAAFLRTEINKIPGFASFGSEITNHPGAFGLDPTKVTVSVEQLNISGIWAEKMLRESHDIQVEMSDLFNLLLIVTAGNSSDEINHFIKALKELKRYSTKNKLRCSLTNIIQPVTTLPQAAISPREAFACEYISLPLEKAAGRICTETVACYPPGIPTICPGEIITQDIIDYLIIVRQIGMHFQGCSDPALNFINVVK